MYWLGVQSSTLWFTVKPTQEDGRPTPFTVVLSVAPLCMSAVWRVIRSNTLLGKFHAGCRFSTSYLCCDIYLFSYFSVTVVNNIFKFRPHRSYASFLLVLPWTSQLSHHTHSKWYVPILCFYQKRCRGVRWNIWGAMKSLLAILPTKEPLSFCLVLLISSISSTLFSIGS